jgi:hypothetical protein
LRAWIDREDAGGGAEQEDGIFWLLTGETEETLRKGRPVSAVVTSVGREDARVKLPDFSYLDGVIRAEDVSSAADTVAPCDRMQKGQTVSARSYAPLSLRCAAVWSQALLTRMACTGARQHVIRPSPSRLMWWL